MGNALFDFDRIGALFGFLVLAVLTLVLIFQKKQLQPSFFYSDLFLLKEGSGWRTRWGSLPKWMLVITVIFLAAALADPGFLHLRKEDGKPFPSSFPTEGIAIFLILDQSGSMEEKVSGVASSGSSRAASKLDLLKMFTHKFVEGDPDIPLRGRPNDLIGIVTFSRGAEVLAPLTLDHREILSQLEKLGIQKRKDQDGTSIGYAIYKTANLIAATRHYAQEVSEKGKPPYEIKNSVMILVTDGLQDPNPLDQGRRLRNIDIPEAAAYAKEQGIRLYIINVEPSISLDKYAAHRQQMRKAAKSTGGNFFLAGGNSSLGEIYTQIDALEKSYLPARQYFQQIPDWKDRYSKQSLSPYFVMLGMVSLAGFVLLETLWLRRAP